MEQRKSTLKRQYLAKPEDPLDTAVTIPAGAEQEAFAIRREARLKAKSGDPTPIYEMKTEYTGWQRGFYLEQVDKARAELPSKPAPAEAAPVQERDAKPELVSLLGDIVFNRHIADAREADLQIRNYRAAAGLDAAPAASTGGRETVDTADTAADCLFSRRSELPPVFTARDVYRRGWKNLSKADVETALVELEKLGRLTRTVIGTGGRTRVQFTWWDYEQKAEAVSDTGVAADDLRALMDKVDGIDRNVRGMNDMVREAMSTPRPVGETVTPEKTARKRAPARYVAMHGVDVPFRRQREAKEVIALAMSHMGNEAYAALYDRIATSPWKAQLFRNVIKLNAMQLELRHGPVAKQVATVVESGAHLEAAREVSILTNESVDLDRTVEVIKALQQFVVDDMDNAASFEEIVEMMGRVYGIEKDQSGWPRFLVESAGLTLVAGVYMVQNPGSVH